MRSLAPTILSLVESRRLIGVFDADLLLSDLKYTMTRGYLSGLALTMRTGLLRSFAAMSVWHEVMQKTEEKAPKFHWDPPQARNAWLRDYAPWIDFVETSSLPRYPRILEGARRDPHDIQTAQLVVFLSPDLFFSRNRRHYPGLRALDERWAEVTRACRDQTVRDVLFLESTLTGSVITALGIAGVQGLVSGLARLDRRILVGLGLLGALAFIHPTPRRILLSRGPEIGMALGKGLYRAVEIWAEQMAVWDALASEAERVLAGYRRTGEHPPYVRERAATVLARADTPMSLGEIQARMVPWGSTRPNDVAYIRRVLRKHPEQFGETPDERWYLAIRRIRPAASAS
jgi:hypothetical protein